MIKPNNLFVALLLHHATAFSPNHSLLRNKSTGSLSFSRLGLEKRRRVSKTKLHYPSVRCNKSFAPQELGYQQTRLASNLKNDVDVPSIKFKILDSIAPTDRGRSANPSQRSQIASLLEKLESQCPLSEPARDPRMSGQWTVMYTDAPPPSNGQLGPFKGLAKQVIDLENGRYRNELYVGGTADNENSDAWLSAILDASWCEWDGTYLDEPTSTAGGDDATNAAAEPAGTENEESSTDYGATTWEVEFETLTLSLFGIPLFTQQFSAGTSRTWKMTYLDDETRMVRAGRTGRGDDDWIFYMKKG